MRLNAKERRQLAALQAARRHTDAARMVLFGTHQADTRMAYTPQEVRGRQLAARREFSKACVDEMVAREKASFNVAKYEEYELFRWSRVLANLCAVTGIMLKPPGRVITIMRLAAWRRQVQDRASGRAL